ncbi:phosphomannose isomerase, putative [Trypanosoma equiperdum]|uniref:mannose-6-phosphate isomerase n=4 Tax=Trypanozoon TaxID=39700 RepID=Q381V7_TRYB2|nr:phosphomannose isomerase, putative [Trypanosoma brucei gambiense DAL972]XP_829536.1 phosphomannose isomerase, putative [Trypanosoma brucei brucei TREU927]RHW67933.1 phosphomannose isomerase [Trypanosoma brucei equiperdum]SCU67789.1 phosphomannose isomerase, putative [Trypanosoma equiperdum]EAN80424.1 phosphomannose isomerase, putative [Trypanosoma brucei brucei TREU927]CBH18539.1 phosphomannose isomerase, putative [Trypanosoma brucei gambiense DAL972]|eukprot:XP_011780803.1 phosphomannose isomerase, putative [Trypanosoma brucei gambiense DAL972]
MSKLIKLDCGVQHYAWGKEAAESYVAKMKGEGNKEGKYAELWVGTHPNCPSKTFSGQNLDDFLKNDNNMSRFVHPKQQADPRFRDTVPFLLKLLSVQTALSIQAHPNKQLAEKLHRENPEKYKDPNHKPELVVALTPFEALCCFRPLKDILEFLESASPLKTLLGPAADVLPGEVEDSEAIKHMMDIVYNTDAKKHAEALQEHAEELRSRGGEMTKEDSVFLRVLYQYPDDMGCWMVYFLNYVQLAPGEGLFLADSEPHAYLFGDSVEIMACSDNVVRAGLTPKWKDVPTLLRMLRYGTDGLERAKFERYRAPEGSEWELQHYSPPREFQDFSLYRIEHRVERQGQTHIKLPTVGLGFCVEGCGIVNGERVRLGECFLVPYGDLKIEAFGDFQIFVASMNYSLHSASHM